LIAIPVGVKLTEYGSMRFTWKNLDKYSNFIKYMHVNAGKTPEAYMEILIKQTIIITFQNKTSTSSLFTCTCIFLYSQSSGDYIDSTTCICEWMKYAIGHS
jgi:hypothetical protein